MSEYRDSSEVVWRIVLYTIVGLAALFFVYQMKVWRYEECLKVGHSESYCTAEALGCVGGGR